MTVPLRFPLMQGDRFTVKIETYRRVKRNTLTMPVGIAELGVAGVARGVVPEQMPETCFTDLVDVDGVGAEVRVSGTTAAALAGGALTVTPCEQGALALDAGKHVVRARASARNPLGIDVTRLVLSSGAGGAPVPRAAFETSPSSPDPAPRVRTLSEGRSSTKLAVEGATEPFWLVLGQSKNDGWVATVDGKRLGSSQLVDGYANGWLITPDGRDSLTVSLVWEPQRIVGMTIAISAAAFLVALGIVVVAFARRRRTRPGDVTSPDAPVLTPGSPVLDHRTAATIGTVAAVTLVGAVTVRPWVGLGVGALTLLAVRAPRWRLVLRLVPAALMVGVAFYVSVTQFFVRYPPRFEWVTFYDEVRVPTWIAVLLVAADAPDRSGLARRAHTDRRRVGTLMVERGDQVGSGGNAIANAIPPRLGYQPALDGLRAVAVVAVLLYHDNSFAFVRGGFLGVDVFFVLSGFLITTILLADHARRGRTVSAEFWVRRVRRLLPAFLIMMLLVAAYVTLAPDLAGRLDASPTGGHALRRAGLGAFLYASNWQQVYWTDFLPTPVSHMWSLSIEEQWYVVWPFLLGGLVWLSRGRSKVLAAWIGVLAVASATWMAVLYRSGPGSRAFFGTDTRAWELLAGALLSVVMIRGGEPHERSRSTRRAFEGAAVVGLATIVWACTVFRDDDSTLYPGGAWHW